MTDVAICTVTFADVIEHISSPTAAQSAILTEAASFAEILASGDEVDTQVVVDYVVVGFLAAWIWAAIALVFVIFAALPLTCARCCCTTRCCPPKDTYVISGYPAVGCNGYCAPTIAWVVLWAALAALTIYTPFALQALGNALDNWTCVVVATTTTVQDTVSEVSISVDTGFGLTRTSVGQLVATALGLLAAAQSDAHRTSDILNNITTSLVTGCNDILNSSAYVNLTSHTEGAYNFDCSALTVGDTPINSISTVLRTINDSHTTVGNAESDILNSIKDIEETIKDTLGNISSEIDTISNDLLFAEQTFTSLPLVFPVEGVMTVAAATNSVTDAFPLIGAVFCSFTFFGLLIWLIGVIILACAKCRHSGSHDEAQKRRPDEVKGSCGGRCLTKSGCLCSYWGAFILCFVSFVFLALTPAVTNVVAFYYSAPYEMDTILGLLDAADFNLDDFDISQVVTDCFFNDASLLDVAGNFGFDIDDLSNQFNLSSIDLTGSFNINSELDSARSAIESGRSSLNAEGFTAAELAAANRSATYCCDYAETFALFVTDCADAGSTCNSCDALLDCSDPVPCNPSPTSNAGLSKQCHDWATSAYTIMQDNNQLIDIQNSKLDAIVSIINAVETRDIIGTIQNDVNTLTNTLPDDVTASFDGITCQFVPNVYYGVYQELLSPIEAAIRTVAIVVVLVIFLTLILVFVGIPVDVRLGNDGIDLNNIQYAAQNTTVVQSHEVEMVHVDSHRLPVAEPVGGPGGQSRDEEYSAYTDEYGREKTSRVVM